MPTPEEPAQARARIEALFEAALEVPESERSAFVSRSCPDDAEAARQVLALLRAHGRETGVLDGSPGRLDRMPAEPAVHYGPYRILRALGSGGMGDVYLAAREDAFMRRVALKVVRGAPWSDEAARRFETERQIMASLNHGNIAQLLDGGVTEEGVPYLAMEYVEGLPLTDFCDREKLSVTERLALFRKVCAAVHHAHRNLVIHRDLKPSNILVTVAGEPKLLDFGIAKLLHPTGTALRSPVTRPGLRPLTPEYASPEQLRGEPLTTSSDVFSLGVVLYELLTGRRPFDRAGTPAAEIEEAVREHDPVRPSGVVAALRRSDATAAERVAADRGERVAGLEGRLRGDLDAMVMMALRKEPGRRYASVEQMSGDIDRHLTGDPVVAFGESRAYRLRKFLKRHRLETAAVGAVVASLLVGAAVATWQAGRARAARDRAARAAERAEASADFLVGLFQTQDPREVIADTLSARTMLERGLAQVDALEAYPRLRARLRTVVARAYRSLGAYGRADDVLSAAMHDLEVAEARDPITPEAGREKAVTLAERADLSTAMGRYEEALASARQAHAVRVRRLGAKDPDVAASLLQMGSIMVYLGDLAGADSLTRQAVALRRASLGEGHPKVTNAVESLASLALRGGDVDEAEALLREVVLERRARDGAGSTGHATALVRLANLLTQERGDHADAEALYRRALLILDPSSPETATALAGLADVLAAQGRWREARDAYDGAVRLRSSIYGADALSVADLLYGQGVVLLGAGDVEQAERVQRRALAIWERTVGPEHPAVAYALTGLAQVAAAQGAWDRAEALARQALAVRRDAFPEGGPLVATSEAMLGEVLGARGDFQQADSLLTVALATIEAALPEGHREVRAMHTRLATFYERAGRGAEAARHRALAGGPPPR